MPPTFLQKYFIYPVQGAIVHILFSLVALIPVDWASAFGGWFARTLGRRLKVNKVAYDNLRHAFPDKTEKEYQQIIEGVWDNLGRVAFEFAHIPKLNVYENPDRFEIVGKEYIDQLRDDDQPGIFFSGHFANWEFCAKAVAETTPSLPVHLIYRSPNNPYMRALFDRRKPTPACQLIPKGASGARQALKLLKAKEHLAMLVDQKMNDGVAVEFFGRDAMTAPAIAQFAQKYNCPIVPVQIERIKGVKFRITFNKPIYISNTGNKSEDILMFMKQVNAIYEDWIKQNPAQWLWLHRRWPK